MAEENTADHHTPHEGAETTEQAPAQATIADARALPPPPPPQEDPEAQSQPASKKKSFMEFFNLRNLVNFVAIMAFILSIPIMFIVIYLVYIGRYECENLLSLPRLQLAIAIFLAVVFVVSNLVVYFRSRFPITGVLVVMIPLLIILVVGLGLVGAYKVESRKILGSPSWLKSKLHDDDDWSGIKSCIYETRTCKDLISRSYLLKPYDFTPNKLSSIEAGCCVPPPICDMEYVNVTYWRIPANVTAESSDLYISDCNLWRNKESVLCYNCNACKDGYLRTLEEKWLRLGTFLITISLLLATSHLLLFVATMWKQYGA
ncbi:PREDICTED: tetraspanin-15-like [Ipomoea nil]|uniref:tetraspanin-15-like n=1 Tax=Ipomoea nil TaxID=35883 RepID=UPI000900A339|nr:PREDICTED: tetraspanin-15-like [Ipomoea nil]